MRERGPKNEGPGEGKPQRHSTDCQVGPCQAVSSRAAATGADFPKPGSAPGPELRRTGKAVLFFKDSPEMSQFGYDVKIASRVVNSGLADESTEGGFP